MHDQSKTDDQDERATDDAPAKDYKDDPAAFAASSDYATRGTTNQYSGGKPGDESGDYASGRDERGAHAGNQEQWRGAAAASSGQADGPDSKKVDAAQEGEAYGDVPSRSADPGQSSYGGFRNEGPSKHDAMQQKASDGDALPKPDPKDDSH